MDNSAKQDASVRMDKLRKEIADVDRQILDLQHKKFKLEKKYNVQRRILWGKSK